MGGGGRASDFQLSGRATERERRGTNGRIWRKDAVVSVRRFERRRDKEFFRKSPRRNRSCRSFAPFDRVRAEGSAGGRFRQHDAGNVSRRARYQRVFTGRTGT